MLFFYFKNITSKLNLQRIERLLKFCEIYRPCRHRVVCVNKHIEIADKKKKQIGCCCCFAAEHSPLENRNIRMSYSIPYINYLRNYFRFLKFTDLSFLFLSSSGKLFKSEKLIILLLFKKSKHLF